ncbi:MAG: response regulator [Myxococcales bacterium]|nr:MAG: response regulator [Myxococcales bacterium]
MMQRPVVLLVDDDEDMLECLEVALGAHYELLFATNGARALELVAAGPIDVMVLDLMMPVVDGFKVLDELAKRDSKLPVILASAMQGLAHIGIGRSVVDRITKPYSLESLQQRIDRALESSPSRVAAESSASAARISHPPLGAEPVDAVHAQSPRASSEDSSGESVAAAADSESIKLSLV